MGSRQFLWVPVAGAISSLVLAVPARPAGLPAIPKTASDCVYHAALAGTPLCVDEPAARGQQDGLLNTGLQTNAPPGFGIKLQDHDLYGTEGGNPAWSDSDYIYAWAGYIYFDSDSEYRIPSPTWPINVNALTPVAETGLWQRIDQYWTAGGYQIYYGGNQVNALWAYSDTPEPATWALLITGLGFAGAALRRGKVKPAT